MIAILNAHGVQTKVEGNKTYALDEWFNTITKKNGSKWVNVTNWTTKQVRDFLGY